MGTKVGVGSRDKMEEDEGYQLFSLIVVSLCVYWESEQQQQMLVYTALKVNHTRDGGFLFKHKYKSSLKIYICQAM